MRFLADEGVDGTIVGSIRGNGRDVRWMAEELQELATTSSLK